MKAVVNHNSSVRDLRAYQKPHKTRPVGQFNERRKIAYAFGQGLRELRLARGFTQRHLAQLCGVNDTYPCTLEAGRKHPSLFMIVQLAKALDITPELLVIRSLAHLKK